MLLKPLPSLSIPTSSASATATANEAPSSRVQMADIARMAGVSVSTVSRALSDSPLVNAATRQRIGDLAKSLNYTINIGAQNLRLKQNRTVSVVVPYDPQTRQHLSDPFFLSLIGSLADTLTERGYEMLLSRVDVERLDLAANGFHTGRAMGVVLIGQWHQHDQLNAMAVRGVPFVVWGAQMPHQVYATVGGDNVGGGRLATRHLLAQGAKKIVFMGDPELPEIGQRLQGYRLAHDEAGIALVPQRQRQVPFVTEAVEAAVQQLMSDGVDFDAIFAASDLMAMTVISSLRKLGRSVPDDCLLVGYDDIALAAQSHPPLTTVSQPIQAAGRALIDELLSQVGGARAESHQLPTELVPRQSSQRG